LGSYRETKFTNTSKEDIKIQLLFPGSFWIFPKVQTYRKRRINLREEDIPTLICSHSTDIEASKSVGSFLARELELDLGYSGRIAMVAETDNLDTQRDSSETNMKQQLGQCEMLIKEMNSGALKSSLSSIQDILQRNAHLIQVMEDMVAADDDIGISEKRAVYTMELQQNMLEITRLTAGVRVFPQA
jgi:hypothetical protein